MSFQKTKAFVLFLILLFSSGCAQPKMVRQTMRKKDRQERMDRRADEKERKAVLKHRFRIQTKEVRKRMKRSARKAERWNNMSKEPFYKSLFKRNKPKKRNI